MSQKLYNQHFRLTPEGTPNKGILFENNESNHRSGHLSHAPIEFKKNCVMAFYSKCSSIRNKWLPGHNGFGWLEYKCSRHQGGTFFVSALILKRFLFDWEFEKVKQKTVQKEKKSDCQAEKIKIFPSSRKVGG